MDAQLKEKLDKLVASDRIVLFMKGDKFMPQCGFSAKVVAILSHLEAQFTTYDVLVDDEIRSGMKEYSDWPTFPQLYVDGELVGGCDIVTEMYQAGEIQPLISQK